MTALEFKDGELRLALSVDARDGVRVDWSGRSSHRDPKKILAAFFGDVLQHAAASGAIQMHFEKLEHFNSSTITALIAFLRAAHFAGVELTMVFDPGLKWQSLSFEALRVFERPDGLFKLRPLGAEVAARN